MNVVIRGLMATGMGVYAAIHIQQAFRPPDGAPGWLGLAFALSSLAAIGIAVMLILTSTKRESTWEIAAAVLAALSAAALLLSLTVGFLGVREPDIRAETGVVLVAEVVVLIAFAISRLRAVRFGVDVDEVDGHVPDVPTPENQTGTADGDRGRGTGS